MTRMMLGMVGGGMVLSVLAGAGIGSWLSDVEIPTPAGIGLGIVGQLASTDAAAAEARYETLRGQMQAELDSTAAAREKAEEEAAHARERVTALEAHYEQLADDSAAQHAELRQAADSADAKLREILIGDPIGQNALMNLERAWESDYSLLESQHVALLGVADEQRTLLADQQRVIDGLTGERTLLLARVDLSDSRIEELSGKRKMRWGPGVTAGFPVYPDVDFSSPAVVFGITMSWS